MESNQMEVNKEEGKAHSRKRKKQYYNRIRHQMEFYFGDANLSKDRFLNKLLAINEYVSLDVFLRFNKMKEIANGIEEIQKALESSEMLELSSDQQSVRRITEIKRKDNIDECTIYVECLPPNATHETVRNQFKQFGNVSYVSLPKYRTSGRIKEFAFVEFEDKSGVENCISTFRQLDGIIGQDTQDPENLKSVMAYVKEQEDLEKDEGSKEESNEDEQEKVETKKIKTESESDAIGEENVKQETKTGAKRPKEEPATSCDLGSDSPPTKRAKVEESEQDAEHEQKQEQKQELEQELDDNEPEQEEDQELDHDHELDADIEETHGSASEHKKKRRKRRKQNPPTATTPFPNDNGNFPGNVGFGEDSKNTDDPIQSLVTLRVATKTEWKRLRNNYLNLQRQRFSEVKKLLLQQRKGDNRKKSTLPLSTVRPVTMKPKKYASPPPSKRLCSRNINFYGAMRDDHNTNTYECSIIDENKAGCDKSKDNAADNEKQYAKDLQFEYEPGLIVKVNFDVPCTDIVDFKAEMRQYPYVRYIDVKEGQTFAYVRVDSSRSAPVLIKHCAPNRCQILTGENETEYWSKIAKDREQKLSKAVKVPKTRSRKMKNLIKNIAEVTVVKSDNKTTVTHIRFDD